MDPRDLDYLHSLPAGRHYGGSPKSDCWTMVGRALTDVREWSTIPPAASLTYVWGQGSCRLGFEGGGFEVVAGDWMWIDRGFGHRGINTPGSDFLTVFLSDAWVEEMGLDIGPIGARAQPAPREMARLLTGLAVRLLRGRVTPREERPVLDVVLEHVGSNFAPGDAEVATASPEQRARLLLQGSPTSSRPISEIAAEVGLRPAELSRRFAERYKLSPVRFRKQLRLLIATRALTAGATVSEAAAEAAFADPAHLSRTFREQYGIPPSRWVARLRCAPSEYG